MKWNKIIAVKMVFVLLFAVLLGAVGIGFAQDDGNAPIIKAIVVRGNNKIDTELIQTAIQKTKLENPIVEQDILDDMDAIYHLGYFYDVTANFELTPGGVKIIFSVDENPVVRDIVFKGATRIPIHEFKQQMQVRPGEVLNVNALLDDVRLLPDWVLMEYGIALRPTDLKADDDGIIEIEVAETVLKDILIDGNEKTMDHVILRELSVSPGDILDMNKINNSLRRILMLGFFDEISRSFDDGENPDETIMTIHVTESKTGAATFGAGYSSVEGIFGFLDVAEENFMGRGQRINAYLEIGANRRVYELGFFEPYIDSQGTSLGANLYNRKAPISALDGNNEKLEGERSTTGFDLTLGRRFGDFTTGRLTLKAQNIGYQGAITGLPAYANGYNNRIIGLGLATNTTDHPFNPSEGYKNDIYIELGTSLLGGDSVFSKIELDHSRYYEVREGGYIFALRGKGGRLLSGTLEESELFRIGGSESLRGYNHGADGLTGDKMFVMNAELRFPIIDKVQGVAFTDWGKAWEDGEEINLTELLNSYGLGVRVDTPIGMLRLDYGFGYNEEEDKRQGQFYFGFGQTF